MLSGFLKNAVITLLVVTQGPAAFGQVSTALTDNSNCDSFICWPIVARDRPEWWTRHYLLPGVHQASAPQGTTHGFEVSYFFGLGLGGVGLLASRDTTPEGRRVGFGVEMFLTYFGIDVTRTSKTFSYEEDVQWRVRPMASVGWASLYYQVGAERQTGVLLKLPIRLSH